MKLFFISLTIALLSMIDLHSIGYSWKWSYKKAFVEAHLIAPDSEYRAIIED